MARTSGVFTPPQGIAFYSVRERAQCHLGESLPELDDPQHTPNLGPREHASPPDRGQGPPVATAGRIELEIGIAIDAVALNLRRRRRDRVLSHAGRDTSRIARIASREWIFATILRRPWHLSHSRTLRRKDRRSYCTSCRRCDGKRRDRLPADASSHTPCDGTGCICSDGVVHPAALCRAVRGREAGLLAAVRRPDRG